MKKIFLSTTITNQLDSKTGMVLPAFKAELQAVLKELRKQPDVEVFCAAEDGGWKFTAEVPAEGVVHDIAHVDAADILVAIVHDAISAGVQFEIGYAVAKQKPVVLAMEAGHELAYFNKGLVGAGLVTLVAYDAAASLATQLPIAVNAPADPLPAVAGPAA
jgi:nucleoside 2-deoxyribosyltransferase